MSAEARAEQESQQTSQVLPLEDAGMSNPHDGGYLACLQVAGSFMLWMNTWGLINTFGVYQTFYEQHLLATESQSNISWIGSIQAFLLMIVGAASGPLFDRGYFYALLWTGSFLVVFGMMMTSLCHHYWQVMLAQGLVVGVGFGCLFVPSVAIVATYFSSKKSLATGIAATGSSLGGVIYPIMFQRLQPIIGFGWATRVIGFVALATLSISIAIMRVRMQPKSVRRLLDPRAFKEIPYTLFSVSIFFNFMGIYIPFFYITTFANQEAGVDSNLAFYLVAILNAASAFGRILPSFLADKIGPLNIIIPACFCSFGLAYAWIGIKNEAGIIVFAFLYGFFSGSVVSLPPMTVVSLTPDLQTVGTRMGMAFSTAGLGILIGNPVAGAILRQHGWPGVQAFCATAVALGFMFSLAARLVRAPQVFRKA